MLRVGFEPTIPQTNERSQTHILERAVVWYANRQYKFRC